LPQLALLVRFLRLWLSSILAVSACSPFYCSGVFLSVALLKLQRHFSFVMYSLGFADPLCFRSFFNTVISTILDSYSFRDFSSATFLPLRRCLRHRGSLDAADSGHWLWLFSPASIVFSASLNSAACGCSSFDGFSILTVLQLRRFLLGPFPQH
jgi:hypothetical protein